MQRKQIILIISFAFLFCTAFPGDAFNFSQLTIGDGLSSGSVTCVLQDSKGFMWIGTEDGLNKYDGYQIIIYRHNPQISNSIAGNSIRCLFEDSQNNLWIGLKGDGLCRLNLTTGQYTSFRYGDTENSISYNDVSGIVEDKQGKLWIAVDRGGLDMFDPVTGAFTHYPLLDSHFNQSLNNALTDIVLDDKGNIWLSSWGGGIYCFDITTKNFTIHPYWKQEQPDEKVCKHIYSLYVDKEGLLWVSSAHGGLYALDETNKDYRQYTFFDDAGEGLNTRMVHSVCEDEDGNLWIATINEGIHIIDKQSGQITHIHSNETGGKNLLSNNINCVYKDNTGIIWIGTHVGVNYYSPLLSQFSLVKKENHSSGSLSENQVLSLLKDSKGNIWIGEVSGIDKISPDGKTIKRYHPGNNSPHPDLFRFNQAICEDRSGNIWIGGYSNYLMKYNPQKDNFTQIKIPSPANTDFSYRNIYTIYEDWDRTLWLATELGTLHYDPSTGTFTPLFESEQIIYPDEKSRVVFRDQDMELWVGTERGLRRYDRNLKLKHIYTAYDSIQKPITNNFITDIYEDKNGIFWIGTMGGLHRFDKKEEHFELIKRLDMAYGDPVFGICKDRSDNLWISTTSGILKYDIRADSFHIYTESDGLQGKDFQQRAFFQTEEGEFFFGGKGGFNSFFPEKLKMNDRKPTVVITDFLIFNQPVIPEKGGILTKPVSETAQITINHRHSVISFKFVALNYISPQKNRYAYRMEGFDQDWIEAGSEQRTAIYTNLDPGEYTFKVKASNNDGVWNEEPVELKITIKPPFWRTAYAYLLYMLILTGIIYLIIKYFTVRERDRNNLRIAKIEADRIREMEKIKINLFTNVSHEFRTPLSLILGPLTQIIDKKSYRKEDEGLYTLMHRNAQRLLRLINQLLDFRKMETGKLELNLQYDNVIKFITNLTGTFSFYATEKNIRYTVVSTLPDLWMNFDADKLDKILYNLISNAFHYTSEGGKVDVLLSEVITEEKRYLQMQVKDTGVGISTSEMEKLFTTFYQGKRQKTMYEGGSGIGLAFTKGLIELHQGKISVDSKVNEGTTFTVQLPVNHAQAATTIIEHSPDNIPPEALDKEDDIEITSDADMVLVVEDNSDMRSYIKNILGGQFNVILAKDGQEGLEMALDIIPDLIISDIMMPCMDGIEMVRALKNNEKTNHIPIILLTSLHNESQVVEGYEIGVEDYITKPFSATILHARIQNLLLSRKKIWEQYTQSKNLEEYEEKLSENPQKQVFVKKISEVVMAHIAETDFGIEVLADELKMSPNQLFRKVKALMNTTPYNVIIQIRMTHAATLIKEGNYNISEVSFLVGYQELSNFSRAFKKHFNVSPREYLSSKIKG
ncbi:MAG: two-component regulator propeller domain-containing protein [Proteiniphilum sp.]|uniref:two-component regulator propeller domain-containing protein n=1 Tax=Proteiniphilum sp. TaxID=1926877 RepID=UPI002B211989|nr:two-component regulator propeller domain-containing protein [Proteiniphilum sp.]MEA5128453.1 two-component regulator propeller domain-containing protein [Proteiniphilum sp.]